MGAVVTWVQRSVFQFCGAVNGDDRAAGLKEKLSKALSELVKLRRTENDLRAKLNAFGSGPVAGTGEDAESLRRRVCELNAELASARAELQKASAAEYPKLLEANRQLEARLGEVEGRLAERVRELGEEQQLRRQFEQNLQAEKQLRSTLNAYLRVELQAICTHVRGLDNEVAADVLARLMNLTDKLDVEYTSEEIVARLTEVGEMTEQLRTLQAGLESYEKRVRELETYLGDKTQNEQTLVTQLHSLGEKYDSLTQRIVSMSKITEQKEAELKTKEDELRALQLAAKQTSDDHDTFARRTKSLEQNVRELELKNEMLRAALDSAVLKADEKTQELSKKIESNKDWEVQEAVRKAVREFAEKMEDLKKEHRSKIADKDAQLSLQQATLTEQRQRFETQRLELQTVLDERRLLQDQLKEKTAELQEKVARLEQARDSGLPASGKELEKLRSEIRSKEEAISQFQEDLRAVEEETQRQISEAKESLEKELQSKQAVLTKLDAKERELREHRELLEAKSRELEAKSRELETTSSNFAQTLTQKDAAIMAKECAIKEKEELLAQLRDERGSEVVRAKAAALAAQVQDLEQQKVSITIAKESLERQLVDCEDKISDLEEAVCSLEDQLASKQDEIAKLNSQVTHQTPSESEQTTLKAELEEARAELGDTTTKLEEATTKLEEATTRLEELSRELETQKQELVEARAKKERLVQQTSDQESDQESDQTSDQTSEQMSDDEVQTSDGEEQMSEERGWSEEKTDEKAAVEADLVAVRNSLESELRVACSGCEELSEKVVVLEESVSSLQEELREAEASWAEKLSSNVCLINDLKNVIGELEKSKCELTTEASELRSQLEEQDPARAWQFDAGLIRYIEEAKKASSSMASINLTRKCQSGEMVRMLRKAAYYFASRAEGLREETNVLKTQLAESAQTIQKTRHERAQDQETFSLRLHNATMDMEKLDSTINALREQLATEKRGREQEVLTLRRDNETLTEQLNEQLAVRTALQTTVETAETTPKTRSCPECDSRKHQAIIAPTPRAPDTFDLVKATIILGAITCIYVGYQLSYLTN
ncbi:hypothetical protein GNI_157290 [Gregarina niphandrodes]|uniref:Uncharacterized protein n=1 Tax=Gregarina niphandrodes TaxID=110365 RepID=A0A023AYU9_GRENI|nr:hypothetical protein GNI_157290 [Gregarina niphandrodes]EZG43847.1 hypothetical protein GNI_157290 [Gregarina niphandrodes]|eukprot:XP_011132968.1 hypothetical protein GNI_157290 [Gregarina niphandrodes]